MTQRLTFDQVVDRLEELGLHPRGSSQVDSRCPAHDDRKSSLSVGEGDDGTVLITCWAGCSFEQVIAALTGRQFSGEPSPARLARVRSRSPLRLVPTHHYDYACFTEGVALRKYRGQLVDEVTGEVARERAFVWTHIPADGRERRGANGHMPQLYNSEAITWAQANGQPIFVAEGESDADALVKAGVAAVSPAHGAGTWLPEWTKQLAELTGPIFIVADDDEVGRAHAIRVATELAHLDVQVVLPAVGKDARDHVEAGKTIKELRPMDTAKPTPRFVALSTVQRRRIDWLWPSYIPARRLTVIEGHPGVMKSTLSLDLAARVTTGSAMPDGTSSGMRPANVLVISAEDDAADTIRPRMEALGADIERVYVLGADDDRLLSFPDDTRELEEFITANKIALVVLDPLNAFLADTVRTNTDHSVRRALTPLGRMAGRTGVTILVIRHLTKRRRQQPTASRPRLYRLHRGRARRAARGHQTRGRERALRRLEQAQPQRRAADLELHRRARSRAGHRADQVDRRGDQPPSHRPTRQR